MKLDIDIDNCTREELLEWLDNSVFADTNDIETQIELKGVSNDLQKHSNTHI